MAFRHPTSPSASPKSSSNLSGSCADVPVIFGKLYHRSIALVSSTRTLGHRDTPRAPTCSMQNTAFNPTSQLCVLQFSTTISPAPSAAGEIMYSIHSHASSRPRHLASLARLPDPPSCRILIASAFCSGVEMRMTVGPIPPVAIGMASPSAIVGAGVTGGEGRCPGASCGAWEESEQVSVVSTDSADCEGFRRSLGVSGSASTGTKRSERIASPACSNSMAGDEDRTQQDKVSSWML